MVRFSGCYGTIVNLARVVINRLIVNPRGSKIVSCNREVVVLPSTESS
jgi:hypothetical protein